MAVVAAGGCAARATGPPTTPPVTAPTSAATSQAVRDLQVDLTRLFADESAPAAVWGVQVRSADRHDTLYSLNQRTLLMPASTLKLVTLAAAAARLGWDFTFETQVLTAGQIDGGVLDGDLVVRGTGDPTIGINDAPSGDSPDDIFAGWARTLKAVGVHRVSGRLVGDDRGMDAGTTWAGNRLGDGWTWDDLVFGFAAPGGALTFHENVATLVIEPGSAPDMPTSARIEQPESGLELVNHVMTGPADSEAILRLQRLAGDPTLAMHGSLPHGSTPVRQAVSVDNPTLFFLRTLRQTLIREGIEVVGGVVDIDDATSLASSAPDDAGQILIRHRSPPLSAFAVDMMKHSQNLFAEALFRALGSINGDGTVAASQEAVSALLSSWTIGSDQFIIADGSGLSRYNYVTAEALVGVLEHVRANRRFATLFEATLPLAGRDGTLAARMAGTLAAGNARAKTGTLSNVSALSGFVDTRDGETLVFAILANNYHSGSSEINRIIDRAVEALASFRR